MEEIRKNVDESWKDSASKEKDTLKNEVPDTKDFMPPEANFSFFISTLALQASIFLGQIPNPATNKKEEKNLPQAKFIIDTLGVLKEKTQNNLNAEETKLLENILYELRLQYTSDNK
ncbi:MAG: DUF1844 domain-containing protein [Candidatus Omnitrophota bacterium]